MIPRLAYVLLAVVMIGDVPSMFRRRAEARERDRGSYYVFVFGLGFGYWAAFDLAARGIGGPLGPWAAPLAVALSVGGVAFRLWAVRALGHYFTRVVHVSADQPVVEAGPYKWLRHPSYTGGGLAALGVGFALNDPLSVLALAVAYGACLSYRIRVEEAALIGAIGRPYRDYMTRTKRLIPFIY